MKKTVVFVVFMVTIVMLAGLYFRFQGDRQHKRLAKEEARQANRA